MLRVSRPTRPHDAGGTVSSSNLETRTNHESDTDESAVKELDDAWNNVYVHNDRAPFADILADDFSGTFADRRSISKAELMEPTPGGRTVAFSERSIQVFGPTAVTRGRIRIEHPEETIEQRYVRIYSKRDELWQAVAVQVFPIPD